MASKREAVVEELRAVGDDLQSLAETIVQDPKERQRRERRWRILYGVLGAVASLGAQRVATKVYGVLTGEKPPAKGGGPRK